MPGPAPLAPPDPHVVRRRIAWIVAIGADFLQIVALPLFVEGFASPFNDVLDVVVGITLFALLGWHPALLPALVAEFIPGLDLVPTWTAAVFFATRGKKAKPVESKSGATVLDDPPTR